MVKGKITTGGDDGPSHHTRSKKTRTPKSPSMEIMNDDNPLLTDEQKKDAEMEARFKTLTVTGIAEAISTIIAGTTDALKKGKATEGGASKNSRSRKTKSKSSPKDKKKSESESDSESSEDSNNHDSSLSSDDCVDKARDRKKKKKTRSGLSGSKPCTSKDFMACKPEEFKGNKTATDALRWIEEMETTVDVSGCILEDKIRFASQSFKGEAHIWWKKILATWGREKALNIGWRKF
jgi:hypothetical protein